MSVNAGAGPLPFSLLTHTPKTFKSSKSSKNVNLSTQNLKISHQRVALDVDLSKNRLEGFTEITVIPGVSTLKVVKLDCREMKINGVYINGKRTNYIYQDYLYLNQSDVGSNGGKIDLFDYYSDNLDVHQHHLIKQKLGYIFGEYNYDPRDPPREHTNGNTEELSVILPDSLKLELTDIATPGSAIHKQSHFPPGAHHHSGTPLSMRTKNTFSMESYTPIVIKIEYEVINPQNGVCFVTNDKENKKVWHAYTMNTEFNISTSSWVPCIDNLWERSTWSMELSIPRTVNDIGFERVIGTKEAMRTKKKSNRRRRRVTRNKKDIDRSEGGEDNELEAEDEEVEEEEEEDDDDEDEDSDNHDLLVCTGDFNNIKETPHPIDLSKKVVSWSIFNPICANHIGWAMGSFETVTIPKSKRENEAEEEADAIEANKALGIDGGGPSAGAGDDEDGDIPLVVYCLPHHVESALNSCIFFNRAMEFFSKEFGSFPFSSYALVFVDHSPTDNHYFAGLSVVSNKLLYPPDLIEPIFTSTETLLDCLAVQWSGINVVPQQFNDLWCTAGIAKYMSYQFLRKLMGNNEYRFKIKTNMERVIDEDIGGKNPLALQFFRFPISTNDLEFIKLKSPLVLFILDKRMTKTDKSFGLSRVLPKIFLQAMSGDLPNGTLSTQHFQYVCEKVNRNKLDSFFKQWVYGAGVPIFNVTQKFNKKRSIIEMSIRQVQQQETKPLHPQVSTFINDSIAFLEDEPTSTIRPVFSGPMTIRIHEADGIPYEHIVEIKEGNVKLDIQYNSKFRRKKKEQVDDDDSTNNAPTKASNISSSTTNTGSATSLGNVLTSRREVDEWGLVEWSSRDDEDLYSDAFEWIRVDADFEWIARINVKQPDYMYGSQLSNDRDVEAQYDAVRYFGDREKVNSTYCTVLTRTLMDPRYYYGVRIAAAKALGDFSTSENGFIGVKYLLRVFKELYCFKQSSIPLSNDFNNFGAFFLQRSIPKVMCNIRDDDGNVPFVIRNLLLNLVKYNDNSINDFQDSLYISELIKCLTESTLSLQSGEESNGSSEGALNSTAQNGSGKDSSSKFLSEVITEIKRLQKLDEWIPSYHSVVSVTCLSQKVKLAIHGKFALSFEDLLFYTIAKHPDDVRIEAFKGLFVLGGLKNKSILQYYLTTVLLGSNSPYFRKRLVEILGESLSIAAIRGTPSTLDDPEFKSYEKLSNDYNPGSSSAGAGATGIVIEDGGSSKAEISSRRDAFARATLQGAIEILRRDYSIGKGLNEALWELLHSSLLSIYERRAVFQLCELLYQERDSFEIHLTIPPLTMEDLKRKFVVKKIGSGKVVIKREGRNKLSFVKKEKVITASPAPAASLPNGATPASGHTPSMLSNGAQPSAAKETSTKIAPTPPTGEPKLKLKLNSSGSSSKKPLSITLAPPKSKPAASPKKSKKPISIAPPALPKAKNLVVIDKTKVTFKLPKTKLQNFDTSLQAPQPASGSKRRTSSSRPKSEPKSPLVRINGTSVVISVSPGRLGHAPLGVPASISSRYVKISLRDKKVYLSPTPF